jgi:hypothetical protein
MINGNANDIVFCNFGATWEVLRKIGHSAVKMFCISERLPTLTSDNVDEVMTKLIEEKKGKPFHPKEYLNLIVEQTMASIAFGKK